MAQVAAVVWVPSPAQELSYATGMGKEGRKEEKERKGRNKWKEEEVRAIPQATSPTSQHAMSSEE